MSAPPVSDSTRRKTHSHQRRVVASLACGGCLMQPFLSVGDPRFLFGWGFRVGVNSRSKACSNRASEQHEAGCTEQTLHGHD